MNDLINWVIKHWPELAAAVGVGGGGGLAAKKLTDKKQDQKISKLEERVDIMDRAILKVQSDIETNSKFDQEFRNQVESTMTDVKSRLDLILDHLLNKK